MSRPSERRYNALAITCLGLSIAIIIAIAVFSLSEGRTEMPRPQSDSIRRQRAEQQGEVWHRIAADRLRDTMILSDRVATLEAINRALAARIEELETTFHVYPVDTGTHISDRQFFAPGIQTWMKKGDE